MKRILSLCNTEKRNRWVQTSGLQIPYLAGKVNLKNIFLGQEDMEFFQCCLPRGVLHQCEKTFVLHPPPKSLHQSDKVFSYGMFVSLANSQRPKFQVCGQLRCEISLTLCRKKNVKTTRTRLAMASEPLPLFLHASWLACLLLRIACYHAVFQSWQWNSIHESHSCNDEMQVPCGSKPSGMAITTQTRHWTTQSFKMVRFKTSKCCTYVSINSKLAHPPPPRHLKFSI